MDEENDFWPQIKGAHHTPVDAPAQDSSDAVLSYGENDPERADPVLP